MELSDNVTVLVLGAYREFSRLDRHVLYCVEESRDPSYAKYGEQAIDEARITLLEQGFIEIDVDGIERLTTVGSTVVNALRTRQR